MALHEHHACGDECVAVQLSDELAESLGAGRQAWDLARPPPRGGDGAHVAFRAETRNAVDKFHAAGLKAGAKDNGAPGLRTDYAPNYYYAAFLLDGEGNNVEAVCMK
jgi:hypothetical protein